MRTQFRVTGALVVALAIIIAALFESVTSTCTGDFSTSVTCSPPDSDISPIKFSRLKSLINKKGWVANASSGEEHFQFVYNLGAIVDPPSQCRNHGPAVAYQIDDRETGALNTGCYALSGPMNSTNTIIELLEESKPAKGLRLRVSGGDTAFCGRPRETWFQLRCATSGEAQQKTPVFETASETFACQYVIEIETSHACPDTCSEGSNGNVCGSHGECISNKDSFNAELASAPRCECDEAEGWYGPSCSSQCPGWSTVHRSEECSSNGHCDYDKSSGKAACFCEAGSGGTLCDQGISTASAGVPWALFVIFFLVFIGAWYYHRKEIDEPFCPCGECSRDNNEAPTFSSASDYMPPSL